MGQTAPAARPWGRGRTPVAVRGSRRPGPLRRPRGSARSRVRQTCPKTAARPPGARFRTLASAHLGHAGRASPGSRGVGTSGGSEFAKNSGVGIVFEAEIPTGGKRHPRLRSSEGVEMRTRFFGHRKTMPTSKNFAFLACPEVPTPGSGRRARPARPPSRPTTPPSKPSRSPVAFGDWP